MLQCRSDSALAALPPQSTRLTSQQAHLKLSSPCWYVHGRKGAATAEADGPSHALSCTQVQLIECRAPFTVQSLQRACTLLSWMHIGVPCQLY